MVGRSGDWEWGWRVEVLDKKQASAFVSSGNVCIYGNLVSSCRNRGFDWYGCLLNEVSWGKGRVVGISGAV